MIENSTFASPEGPAFSCDASMEQSQVRHCTFWAGGQAATFGSPFVGSGNEITSNIFYSLEARPLGNGGAVVQFAADAVKNFVSNQNLYYAVKRDRALADRVIEWCCYVASRPGHGTPWFRLNGQDGESRFGSPMFVDLHLSRVSTFAFATAPRDRGLGPGGTDAGAMPFRPARKPEDRLRQPLKLDAKMARLFRDGPRFVTPFIGRPGASGGTRPALLSLPEPTSGRSIYAEDDMKIETRMSRGGWSRWWRRSRPTVRRCGA